MHGERRRRRAVSSRPPLFADGALHEAAYLQRPNMGQNPVGAFIDEY
jgi:hypothetical protein